MFSPIAKLGIKRNRVWRIGPWIFKTLRGSNARRRYWSEHLTRKTLSQKDIATVPIVGSSNMFRMIILPNQNRGSARVKKDASYISSWAEHLLSLFTRLDAPEYAGQCFWLDEPKRIHSFSSFNDFLVSELNKYNMRYRLSFLQGMTDCLVDIFHSSPNFKVPFYCLTDISPKNSFFVDGRFVHFDLEGTIIGPRDFLITKAALNLVRDFQRDEGVLALAKDLIDECEDEGLTRSSLAFSLVRMYIYATAFPGPWAIPSRALTALCSNARIKEVLCEVAYAGT